LAAQGLAILMVSSDMDEVLSVSHRIVTVYQGRLTGQFSRAEATREKLLNAAAGDALAELGALAQGALKEAQTP
jgi:ABC-type sugar transport system ATPase subunit